MRLRLAALPRDVWLIGLISLANDGASELVYPLLPLDLTAALGAGPRILGLVEGIAEATASLLKLVSGVLADRTRQRKPWLVVGYGLAGLARPLIALARHWPWLLLLRFTDRLGKGLRSSPRDALLAEVVAPDQWGLAFGVHRAMDNAGAVVGPLLASLLLAAHWPVRHIILAAALPGLVCLLLALALEEPAPQPGGVGPPRTFPWSPQALAPALKGYLGIVGLFTLGNSSNLFLLLRAHDLGVPTSQIPLLWAAVSAVAMVLSAPLSSWSDRVGRRRCLVLGYGAYGAFDLLLGNLKAAGGGIWLLFASYGVFLAATEGDEKALVADLADPHQRGTAFGWFHLITGVTLLPASLLFGWLYGTVSPQVAFAWSASCSLLAALALTRLSGGTGGPAQMTWATPL